MFTAYGPATLDVCPASHRPFRPRGRWRQSSVPVATPITPEKGAFDLRISFEAPRVHRDPAGLRGFGRRIFRERNLYGALAFAETAESLALNRRALAVGPTDRVVGVTSSGDVLLSLLAERPKSVIGFDMNPTQTALAELKLAAIEALEVDDYLRFVGVYEQPAADRVAAYKRISRGVTAPARAAFLSDVRAVGAGLLNRGMTHVIIRALVAGLGRIVEPDTLHLFLGDHGADEVRARVLDDLIRRPVVRRMIAPLLSAFSSQLKWLFFPHRICRVSTRPDEMIARFFETFRPLFVRGARSNPVLCRSATGDLHPEWHDRLYAEPAFERIRASRERVAFYDADVVDGLAALPENHATRIYLSNVPDYLSPSQLDRLSAEVVRVARSGARILYMSLCDEDRLGPRIGSLLDASELGAIRAGDNVHLYPSIVVRVAR